MSREHILTNVNLLTSIPVAFEALWDGDTSGWFIRFAAITVDSQSHPLGVLSDGGDLRLFNGHVPPWPEATAAQQLGSELSERYDAEFYFPSPEHPEDDCPSWKDRQKGYPCRRCGILLLQHHDCPWYGVCYQCHRNEARERREAQWTPEQRAAPRCHICGNPATNEVNGGPACAECFDKYEVYTCENCKSVIVLLKSLGHISLCSRCTLQSAINSLTTTQRNTIRNAMAKGRLKGIQSAMDVMGCSLHDAQYVMHLLDDSHAPDTFA